jgi:hypothetical protein
MKNKMTDTSVKNFIGSREDLVDVMKMMAAIRDEAMKVGSTDEDKKDKYLSLVNILSTGITKFQQGIVKEKIEKISKILDKQDGVAGYDPTQDCYWREKNPTLVQSLDDLLIALQGEHFTRIDDKHHILQAIRFLKAENLPISEKNQLYLSITPYNERAEVPKEGFFKRAASMLLGSTYVVETSPSNKRTLKVYGDAENLDYVMKEATKLGYTKLEAILKYNEATQVRRSITSNIERSSLEVSDLPSSLQGKLVRITKGLTESALAKEYCILGIPLKDTREAPTQDSRAVEYMKVVAETETPDNIEDNLVVSNGNLNMFGKKFEKFVNEAAEKKKVQKNGVEPVIDKDNQFILYHSEGRVDQYSKFTTLLCTKGVRYIVSTISDDLPENYLAGVTEILRNSQDPEAKVSEIATRFNVKFVNLTKYQRDRQPEVYEGFK